MKKAIVIFIVICQACINNSKIATDIYKNTINSTVTIETNISLGSGFLIGENIIVTNYHVIEGAAKAYCYNTNATTKYEIDGYLAVDKSIDLILLKVPELHGTELKISADSLFPGQPVYVIGSPKGLPASISDGIISGLRDFEGVKLIQITAPISQGSSGGPVFNSKGELIGISVGQIQEGQNLNFAIPISNLEKLIDVRKTYSTPITSLYYIIDYFTDNRDGETYKTVKLGTQTWMGQNLNYDSPNKSWCYDDDQNNCEKYGRLYTWESAITACPDDWHLPSVTEWMVLIKFLGGSDVAGTKLKSKTGWDGKIVGSDESQLTFLPGGFRYYEDGTFVHIGWQGLFWSSTLADNHPIVLELANYFYDASLGRLAPELLYSGYSVRCLKDN